MIQRYDSVLVKRSKVRGVDTACASGFVTDDGWPHGYAAWDTDKPDLANYLAAVRALLEREGRAHVQIVGAARLPQSTLCSAPYAFLLSEPL